MMILVAVLCVIFIEFLLTLIIAEILRANKAYRRAQERAAKTSTRIREALKAIQKAEDKS